MEGWEFAMDRCGYIDIGIPLKIFMFFRQKKKKSQMLVVEHHFTHPCLSQQHR